MLEPTLEVVCEKMTCEKQNVVFHHIEAKEQVKVRKLGQEFRTHLHLAQ